MNILVVTLHDDKMTQNLMQDLSEQWVMPKVRLFLNKDNMDLCRIWNEYYLSTEDDLLCFLNNDTRISPNFVSDTVAIFDKEPEVGCVVHKQGDVSKWSEELSYVIPDRKFCQGFDFSMRRKAYTLVPEDIRVFGGDDYLFYKLYENEWKVAVALSSPIIHYRAKSRRYYKYDRNEEMRSMMRYGCGTYPHGAHHVC